MALMINIEYGVLHVLKLNIWGVWKIMVDGPVKYDI